MRWYYGLGILALGALSLAGCGSGGNSSSSTSATPTKVSKPFMGRVDLANFSDTCKRVQCWLPTQFTPNLAEGDSVSLKERGSRKGWPLSGDPIKVLCVAKGGQYKDSAGQLANDWYGVVVPTKRLDPRGHGAKKIPGSDDRLAFVPVYLVRGGEGKQMPAC